MEGVSLMGRRSEIRPVEAARVLRSRAYDFSAKYMAVCTLHQAACSEPDVAGPETLSLLREVLVDPCLSEQTQSYFLFKEAAETLCALITHAKGGLLETMVHARVTDLLGGASGPAHRALAEAVGGLPLSIEGAEPGDGDRVDPLEVGWRDVLTAAETVPKGSPVLLGRSLVVQKNGSRELLVLKCARSEDSLRALADEVRWMRFLQAQRDAFSLRFDIPTPVSLGGRVLFRVKGLPGAARKGCPGKSHAICFKAHPEYYMVPHEWSGRAGSPSFKEVMFRNARLLGQLTSMGIIHKAPIPLFHNRVQVARRPDGGLYEWHRAGRLDRWLESCAYPNFGPTGVRDFEHMTAFRGPSGSLYQDMGSQLLGLFLVAGSWFRKQDPNRVGLDSAGRPVDARDLFDKALFQELIRGIFLHYYEGFAGHAFPATVPFDFQRLITRMIEEMGVDRHMEEVLRAVDQSGMDEETFRDFLQDRGCTDREISQWKKGEKDITLITGPHLGGFNQGISLPELIEALASMSALCILAKYMGRPNGRS